MDPSARSDAAFPATDPVALERLRRFGGQRLLADMVSLFLEAVPTRLSAARTALARDDAAGVEQALHALKSSAAQLGAMHMQRLSDEGERMARAGSLDGMADLLDALDDERPRVQDWLTAARDGEVA